MQAGAWVLDKAMRARYSIGMKTQFDVTEMVGDLVSRGWSYAEIARSVGVQRAQPPKWHRGEQEPSLTNGLMLIDLHDSVVTAERAAWCAASRSLRAELIRRNSP